MKLYTEKQVLNMLRSFHNLEINVQLCMLKLTPIEIPSDEEIENGWHNDLQADYIDGCINGAKWMREQILKQQ